MIQRFRTGQTGYNYQPLPRHFGLEALYFKTHYRANRDPPVALIDPTKSRMLCIIEHFSCIPSCGISTRHNTQPLILMHINPYDRYDAFLGNIDQWDSYSPIQCLMTGEEHLGVIIFMIIKYLYGNKKKQRRQNQGLVKCWLLIRTDFV